MELEVWDLWIFCFGLLWEIGFILLNLIYYVLWDIRLKFYNYSFCCCRGLVIVLYEWNFVKYVVNVLLFLCLFFWNFFRNYIDEELI